MNNKIGNINIAIDLTKIPGARKMAITRGGKTMDCVVLPIDNEMGVVCDAYEAKNPDGTTKMKPFSDVKLYLVGLAHKEIRYGMTHGIKPAFGPKYMEKVTEDQMRNVPWCGNVKPFGAEHIKKDMLAADMSAIEGEKYKGW